MNNKGTVLISSILSICSLTLGLLFFPSEVQGQQQNPSEFEVVFEIPIGDEGIHYRGGDHPDGLRWGPLSFAVAPDGNFWITDSAAIPERIVQYDTSGKLIGTIALEDTVSGISDIEVTNNSVFILAWANDPPRVIQISHSGTIQSVYEIPEPLHLENGLSGIALDGDNDILLELEGGTSLFKLHPSPGEMTTIEVNGYTRNGVVAKANPPQIDSATLGQGSISYGNINIDIIVENRLGGLYVLGLHENGYLDVIADEISSTFEFKLDRTIHRYDRSGNMIGLVRVPREMRFAAVEHELAVGPDGYVYMMLTQPDRVQILRLLFTDHVNPILPSLPDVPISDIQSNTSFSILACQTRDSMINMANAYLNNSTYLDAAHINVTASCDRVKPRYLSAAGTYYSVPYDIGGGDLPSQFNTYMTQSGYFAGDIGSTTEGCSRGVDCAGFVSRCWGFGENMGTYYLRDHSIQIAQSSLLRGDVMLSINGGSDSGRHVILFSGFSGTTGMYGYEATTYSSWDKVVNRYRSWDWLYTNNYVPRKFENVCS